MSRIQVVGVRIPGRWADGWLYKEHLVLWSRVGAMHIVPLKRIATAMRQTSTPSQAVAVEYLVLRNDWKVSEQFRRLLTIDRVREGFLSDIPLEQRAVGDRPRQH